MTNRELVEENEQLRSKLEDIYGQIGNALGFDEAEDEDEDEEDDEEDDEE